MSEYCRITVISLEKSKTISSKFEVTHINDNFQEIRFFYNSLISKNSKLTAHKRAIKFEGENYIDFDLIHAHIGMTNWWHFLNFKSKLQLPMVYSEHGSFFLPANFKEISVFNKIGLKKLMKSSDVVTAVSEVLAITMKKNGGKEIEIIGNSLPKHWENLSLAVNNNVKAYRFLHISTLDNVKNIKGIIDAFNIVKNKGFDNLHLTVVSDENYDSQKEYVEKLGLTSEVQFLGPIEHSDLPTIYQEHNCFILNSYYETFSIVLAEAMHFGLHLISTNVGFLVGEESAPFDEVKNNNPEDLALKIITAKTNKSFSGNQGREFAKRFLQDNIIQKYLELYNRFSS